LLAPAVALIALFLYYAFILPRGDLKSLPDPDLSGAEPQVVEKIRGARQAVQTDPRSAPAWGRLAISLDVHDFQPEAVDCYRQAAELDRDEFLWPYFCAIALRTMGSDEALAWLRRSLALRGDYAPLCVRYGQALLRQGRLEEARASFEKALAADPKAVFGHLGLAQVSLMQNNPQESRAHLASALEIHPGFRQAHGLLADVYRRLGEVEKLERQRRILADLPQTMPLPDPIVETRWASEGVSANWYDRRGTAYSQRGEHARAVAEYRRAVAARPQAGFHNNLAAALFQTGRRREAIETARKALELDPSSAKAYANLATFYLRAGRTEDGFATLREGLSRVPGDVSLQWALAWALATAPDVRRRDGPEAVRLVEGILRAGGRRDLPTLGLLAAAYAASGDLSRAIATESEALARARSEGRRELADKIESRLRLYGLKPPYRESR
jgi:tetratricopeptide (TPR) repeat protein